MYKAFLTTLPKFFFQNREEHSLKTAKTINKLFFISKNCYASRYSSGHVVCSFDIRAKSFRERSRILSIKVRKLLYKYLFFQRSCFSEKDGGKIHFSKENWYSKNSYWHVKCNFDNSVIKNVKFSKFRNPELKVRR